MLPNNFPPWPLVYYHFKRWKNCGLIEEVHQCLYVQCRRLHKKKPQATVAIIDSQSVKTTTVGGEQRGFDMGKKIKGRKRHLAVDSLGLIQAVIVHSASDQDRTSGHWIVADLMRENGRVKNIYADAGYTGKLEDFAESFPGCQMTIVKRTDKSFKILPKRWIVERTFTWIVAQRRNAKDYERLVESSKSMVLLALIRVMIKRLIR
jgi:putative transposase